MANGASKEALGDLHSALANVLLEALGETYTDDEGRPLPPPAAILSVARQFLKDNGIEGQAVTGSPIKSLLDNLPFDGQLPNEQEAGTATAAGPTIN